jgi:hypothetical protein
LAQAPPLAPKVSDMELLSVPAWPRRDRGSAER